MDDLRIDYEAMAAHIAALLHAARARGVGIWRVIFDPKLQPFLHQTAAWSELDGTVRFSTRRSWVRHDEHYHVDFDVPCATTLRIGARRQRGGEGFLLEPG